MERSEITSLPCAKYDTIEEMFHVKQERLLAWNSMLWFSQEVFSEKGQAWFENLPSRDKWQVFRWNDYRAGRLWWEGYKVLAANLTFRKLPPTQYVKNPNSGVSEARGGALDLLNCSEPACNS